MTADKDAPPSQRTIRSFVLRAGRLTGAQQRALDELWPRWGIEYLSQRLDLDDCFGREAPRILEIGFGNGETLAADAERSPHQDFIGIEVHRPGLGRLLLLLEERGLSNVRVVCHDAVEVLQEQLPDATLDGVNIFFPDPWPKKRHHKRRLVQPAFLRLLAGKMKPGAVLHIATDWLPYAEHIQDVLENSPFFVHPDNPKLDDARRQAGSGRSETKFERRGQKLGHGVWDFRWPRIWM